MKNLYGQPMKKKQISKKLRKQFLIIFWKIINFFLPMASKLADTAEIHELILGVMH
jgi:hypothetical protein